jgi:hypothetical protein
MKFSDPCKMVISLIYEKGTAKGNIVVATKIARKLLLLPNSVASSFRILKGKPTALNNLIRCRKGRSEEIL